MRSRDTLGTVFADQQFAALFSSHGQPVEARWRLALVALLQFAENLSDRRAADAARGWIDWKYLLGLDLADPGSDASVLSGFRSRVVEGGAEALLLDKLLALCREQKLLLPRGRQCTDSTHVLGAVRSLNRLGCAIEAMRAALNALAVAAPDWLHGQADPAWADRYAKPADDCHVPLGEAARRACAEGVGRDGHVLLTAMRCLWPSRHRTRQHGCTRCPHPAPAPVALHRPCQNAPPARAHGRRHEPRPPQQFGIDLVRWTP